MGISISGTTLTFNDSTTMTTAATSTSTAEGAVGTYGIYMMGAASGPNVAYGATVAGSSLRYNYSVNNTNETIFTNRSSTRNQDYRTNATYGGGGTSLSGTWRRMSSGGDVYTNIPFDGENYYNVYATALYVRIS